MTAGTGCSSPKEGFPSCTLSTPSVLNINPTGFISEIQINPSVFYKQMDRGGCSRTEDRMENRVEYSAGLTHIQLRNWVKWLLQQHHLHSQGLYPNLCLCLHIMDSLLSSVCWLCPVPAGTSTEP